MTRPRTKSTEKLKLELRSAVLEADALTTRPARRLGGRTPQLLSAWLGTVLGDLKPPVVVVGGGGGGRKRERERDRQTDRQTDRQAVNKDKQTDR